MKQRGKLLYRRPQMTIRHLRAACWIPKATNKYAQILYYSLFLHSDNGCTNASQCYVTRTLPVLFVNLI